MKTIKSITPKQHIQGHHALTDNTLQFLHQVKAHKSRYPSVRDNVTTVSDIDTKRRHDLHSIDTITSKDNKVTFRTCKFLPKTFMYKGTRYGNYDPQGILVTSKSDGSPAYAYIAINASSSNKGSIKFKDTGKGKAVVQFIKIKMDTGNTVVSTNSNEFQAGPPINLEHGQSNALNSNGSIIVFDNREGTETHGGVCQIDKSNLSPSRYGELTFNLNKDKSTNYRFGDDFCGLSNGNYLNICPNTNGKTPLIPKGALMLFWISFDYTNGFHGHIYKQYIRHAGGQTIQGVCENPHSKRVTVLYDDGLLSFPEYRMGRLKPSDIKQVVFNDMRESEGLAYDKNGNAYFLTDRSPELMVSRDLKDF